MMRVVMVGWLLLGCAFGQMPTEKHPLGEAHPVQTSAVVHVVRPKLSAEALLKLAAARKLELACRQVSGPARSRKLELAAVAFDRLVIQFQLEPAAAAQAAWSAAQIWRRHGSAALAEKGYLRAARSHAVRYEQRGLLGAADMQRRQRRTKDAMKTYALAEAADPRTSHAQAARLWIARMLMDRSQVDRAIEKFQAALESAPSPRQGLDAANYLAKAWIVKGDLEAAGFVIEYAEQLTEQAEQAEQGGSVAARQLRLACDRMSARKALQRALDATTGAGADAVRLDEYRRRNARRKGSSTKQVTIGKQ